MDTISTKIERHLNLPLLINFVLGLCFALVLCLSLLGWGKIIAIATFGTTKGDWPFQAAWGICALTLLGGLLNVAGAVSAPVNTVLVALGFVLCLLLSQPRKLLAKWRLSNMAPQDRFAIAILIIVSGVIVASSILPSPWNAADDSLAYAAFPVKMLETGQLIEPFNLRRMVGFGGYQFLHSLVVALRGPSTLHVFDKGILTALTGLAIAYYTRRRLGAPWWLACGAGILFMTLPSGRINLSPTSIMAFLTLALLETFQLTTEAPVAPLWRRGVLLAVVCAGFLSIRANVLVIEGALLSLLVVTERPFSLRPSVIGEKGLLLGIVGVLTVLLLIPWGVSLYRSSGTPFFPLISGTWKEAIPHSAPFVMGPFCAFLAKNIWYSRLVILVIATFVGLAAGALPIEVTCLSAAVALTTVATISSATLYGSFDLWRYYGPFVRLAAVFVGASLLIHWQSLIPGFLRRMQFAGAFLVCIIAMLRPAVSVAKKLRGKLTPDRLSNNANAAQTREAQQAFVGMAGDYEIAHSFIEPYEAALAAIPKGSKVLAAVDAPFLLDYRDHDIVNIDQIGAVSPPPGMPLGGPPEKLAQYLSGLSINYLLYVKPDKSPRIYRRQYWQNPELQAAVVDEPILKRIVENFLWFFDAIDDLGTRYPKVFENDQLVVLFLGPPGATGASASSSSSEGHSL